MYSNNVMTSHYHPGAYGKAVQGQWSCCRKGKTAQGCCETGFHVRPQSEMLWTCSVNDCDDDDDDDCDDDDEMNGCSKSVPSNYGGVYLLLQKMTPLLDTASVISAGVPI